MTDQRRAVRHEDRPYGRSKDIHSRRHTMKRLLGLALLAILFTSPALAEVDWASGPFPEILKQAQQEKKHIFIDFYAVWCGPCKMLEQTTYKDPAVVELLNSMIPAKYDAEKGEGKELAARFKVKAYPTLVLLDPTGAEVDRQLGYLDAETFLGLMRDSLKGIGTIAYYEAELLKDPASIPTLFKLGEKYTNILDAKKAETHLAKIISLDPKNKKGYTDQAYFNLGSLYYGTGQYAKSVTQFETLIDTFPKSGQKNDAFQMLARVYEKMGDRDKCIQTYKTFIRNNPDDPSALNAFAWFCASRQIAMDDAIPYAEKAVELSDGEPGYMDTLAELYYAKGDYAKALEVEEAASAKDPEDVYLKDQIIKYLKASLEQLRKGPDK
jgi:tetratricopeptide (TPR) repeat protein